MIRQAAEDGRQLEIHYYSASSDQESTRIVDPVAVVAIEGRWYLDAYCHNAGGMRRFRVDRVSAARVTGAAACHGAADGTDRAGAGGEADAPADAGPAAFVPGPEATEVRLAVDAGAAWVLEALPVLSSEVLPDGRTGVTLAVASTVWFGRLLLRLGPHAEVLDPSELSEVGRQAALQLLRRYRRGAPPAS